MMRRSSTVGFTLIEVLAAVFLTAIAMTVAIGFFVNLSDSTDAAALKARQGRLALAVVDRIARDLEGAYLLSKPAEVDPLAHPWIFIGESQQLDAGSDRLRFITRNHRPRNALDHGSDLALVTYMLHPSDGAQGFELLRAVSPGLPEELERDFPSASDERFMVVAERVNHFAMRFLSPDGEWGDEWDSSQLEQSSDLPLAVEVEIAHLPPAPPGSEADDAFGEDFAATDPEDDKSLVYMRRVRLPMRPIDLAKLLEEVDNQAAEEAGTGTGDEDEGDDTSDESLPEGLELPEGFDPGQLEPGALTR